MKKHNRIISGIMAVCLMGSISIIPESISPAVSITASAEDYYQYEKLTYKFLENGTIEITGCNTSATKVVIPPEIDGVPVTSIGNGAFYYCNLTSVTFPDSVTSIGREAFYSCKNLTEVTIPDSVTTIGDSAFYKCKSLTEITIPESVTSIGAGAFYDTPWLSSRQAKNQFVIVNNILISVATNSIDAVIPDGVISIGDGAFAGCFNLISLIIPDSVTSIGNIVFNHCESLTEITIPDSVTSIGYYAFANCESLKSITIPDSVISIGNCTFCWCKSLTEITILNPECKIDDDEYTIEKTATIYGYTGSTAQEYAKKYGREFVALDGENNKETPTGDANGDNEFNIADVVILQQYILGGSDMEISDWKQIDLNNDGILDVFDLCLMKKKLIEK